MKKMFLLSVFASLLMACDNYGYDYSMIYNEKGEKKSGIIVGWALKEREEDIVRYGSRWGWGEKAEYAAIADAASPSMSAGATGSMSRFALYDKYLYAVINYQMCIFDLSEPEPVNKGSISVGNKVFRIGDNPQTLAANRILHLQGMDGYDLIPYGNVLMMIADNGPYQYDYSDLNNIRALSVISIRND